MATQPKRWVICDGVDPKSKARELFLSGATTQAGVIISLAKGYTTIPSIADATNGTEAQVRNASSVLSRADVIAVDESAFDALWDAVPELVPVKKTKGRRS